MSDICTTVYKLLRAETGREIFPDTELERDLGMDSLDMMNILMDIEDTYDITISQSYLLKVRTVDDLIKAIVKSQEGNLVNSSTIINDNISNN